jgi:hypothetical protein
MAIRDILVGILPGNWFFLVFLATIIMVRILLFIKPTAAPTINGFRTHHYMYGLFGIAISFLIHSLVLYAIGLGLFIDELTYLFIGGKTHKDNYSVASLTGTLVFIVFIYIFRTHIVSPLM